MKALRRAGYKVALTAKPKVFAPKHKAGKTITISDDCPITLLWVTKE
ncbi:MAG: hypothetical protein AB8G99_24675 [Planctomycetaceae bacterium]